MSLSEEQEKSLLIEQVSDLIKRLGVVLNYSKMYSISHKVVEDKIYEFEKYFESLIQKEGVLEIGITADAIVFASKNIDSKNPLVKKLCFMFHKRGVGSLVFSAEMNKTQWFSFFNLINSEAFLEDLKPLQEQLNENRISGLTVGNLDLNRLQQFDEDDNLNQEVVESWVSLFYSIANENLRKYQDTLVDRIIKEIGTFSSEIESALSTFLNHHPKAPETWEEIVKETFINNLKHNFLNPAIFSKYNDFLINTSTDAQMLLLNMNDLTEKEQIFIEENLIQKLNLPKAVNIIEELYFNESFNESQKQRIYSLMINDKRIINEALPLVFNTIRTSPDYESNPNRPVSVVALDALLRAKVLPAPRYEYLKDKELLFGDQNVLEFPMTEWKLTLDKAALDLEICDLLLLLVKISKNASDIETLLERFQTIISAIIHENDYARLETLYNSLDQLIGRYDNSFDDSVRDVMVYLSSAPMVKLMIDTLRKFGKDKLENVQSFILHGNEETIEALIDCLKTEKEFSVRVMIYKLLLAFGKRLEKPLLILLNDKSWQNRRHAVYLFGELGDYPKVLTKASADSERQVRYEAVKYLIQFGESYLDLCFERMSTERDIKLVRNFVSLVLKMEPDRAKAGFFYKAIQLFEKMIKDEKVIYSLIEKLGLCGDRAYFNPLKEWLEEDSFFTLKKDVERKIAILKALYFLGNEKEKDQLFTAFSEHPEEQIAKTAKYLKMRSEV